MNKKPIILIGGGGHCKSIIEVIESNNRFFIAGIVDQPEKLGEKICGYSIIANDGDLPELVKEYENFHITVGQIKSGSLRKKLFETILQLGGKLPPIIAGTAVVSNHSKIGDGSAIMHQAMVNSDATIGKNCIINSGALIEHDSVIGDFCHISTKAVINGNCEIGQNCFIGSNSVLAQGINITENTLIAAGSSVFKSVKQSGTYIGFPLRKIK